MATISGTMISNVITGELVDCGVDPAAVDDGEFDAEDADVLDDLVALGEVMVGFVDDGGEDTTDCVVGDEEGNTVTALSGVGS
jgi:hypothetical protein